MNFESPLAEAPAGKPRTRLRDGEKAYLDSLTSMRGLPPYSLSLLDLMATAAGFSKCLAVAGHGGACGEALDVHRRRTGAMDGLLDGLRGMMPGYSGAALKRVRQVYGQLAMDREFLARIVARLDQFRNDAGAVMKLEHAKRHHLMEVKRRHIDNLKHQILPEAVEHGLKRAAVSVLTLGFVGEIVERWAHLGGVFWLSYGVTASMLLASGFVFYKHFAHAYVSMQRERLERKYEHETIKVCGDCQGQRRELMGDLFRDLLKAFRSQYPRDEERQLDLIADHMRDKAGIELALGFIEVEGAPKKIFAPDAVMEEKLVEAVAVAPY